MDDHARRMNGKVRGISVPELPWLKDKDKPEPAPLSRSCGTCGLYGWCEEHGDGG